MRFCMPRKQGQSTLCEAKIQGKVSVTKVVTVIGTDLLWLK